MNLYLFIIFCVLTYLEAVRELKLKKRSVAFKLSLVALFIIVCISRVGHSYSYSDLTGYINYFLDSNYVYFEPGYVWYAGIIEKYIGRSGISLVLGCSLWIIFFAAFSSHIVEINSLAPYKRFSKQVFQKRNIDKADRKSIFFVFLLVFTIYWGFAFSTEGLRAGMATSMLMCAAAMSLNGYGLFSIIPAGLAMMFHSSAVLFIPVLIILFYLREVPGIKFFKFWFLGLIVFDILAQTFSFLDINMIFGRLSGIDIEAASHFMTYEESEVGSYFSTQYVTYHAIALIMLKGNFNNEKYSRSVFLYYWGLSMGSLFQATAIVMRVQWLFLVMNVFAIIYMVMDDSIRKRAKINILTVLAIIQSIMIVRYLGVTY